MSALAFASIALQLNSISSFAQQSNLFQGRKLNEGLNWDAFLSKITQLAREQHQPNWNQNGYIKNVQNLLQQCQFPEFENVKKEFASYENKNMTSTKGNIHSLMPNEFTQLVDVFTPSYNEKNEAASIWYQVNEEVNFENNPKLFEAEYALS